MDRLSVLDAQFLHLEDACTPMHIASLCTFAGAPPSRAEVLALLDAKLPLMPLYRKKVRYPPLELGRPVWVDDPRFDPRDHVHLATLPPPGGDAELCKLMGELMAQRLDRDRPLWEIWIIDGLAGDRWAFVSKVHHSMVDGISGVALQIILLDDDPNKPLPPAEPFAVEPQPSPVALVLDAWRGLAGDALGVARRLAGELRRPRAGLRDLGELAAGFRTYTGKLLNLRRGAIYGKVGTHRSYAHASVEIADVQTIRKGLGGSLNDVVLAAISGAYRVFVAKERTDPDRAFVRSLVPVSVRGPDEGGALHNLVSAVLCDLPIDVADPVERLRAVIERMATLKSSHMAEAGAWLVGVGDLAPPMIVGAVTRLVARAMHTVPQRFLGTVTTNVPGPKTPLFFLGRRLLDWYPYVPISQGLRVGTAILSYDGRLAFGITGDGDSVPDAAVVARAIEAEIAQLVQVAGGEAARKACATWSKPKEALKPSA